jgi:hypothetical protein
MKSEILKLSTIVLLLLFLGAGCNKDEQNPNPEAEFYFQLLDKNYESKTVFNEGENFIFSFKIETQDTIWKFNRLVNDDPNFFRVFRIVDGNYINMGKSFKSKWCQPIYYECGHETPFIFELPWKTDIGTNEIPDQNIWPPFCLFNETSLLPKGKYITYFDEKIEFVRCGDLIDTNYEQDFFTTKSMHFEIEFEIQ